VKLIKKATKNALFLPRSVSINLVMRNFWLVGFTILVKSLDSLNIVVEGSLFAHQDCIYLIKHTVKTVRLW